MACAMGEVGTGLPERDTGQGIEIAAARAFRKTRRADRNHALQGQREEALLLVRHLADGECAGDVGGAVYILRARIDQEHLGRPDLSVAFRRHAVMHDRSILAGPRNGVERDILEWVLHALADRGAHGLELLRRRDLRQAAMRLLVEPVEELDHGHAILQMGGSRAIELDHVLHGASELCRIIALDHLATAVANHAGECVWREIGIDEDAGTIAGHPFQPLGQDGRIDLLAKVAQIALDLKIGLCAVEEEFGRAVCLDDRARQRMRRMRYVAAPQIEDPGDRRGIGNQNSRQIFLGEIGADLLQLIGSR